MSNTDVTDLSAVPPPDVGIDIERFRETKQTVRAKAENSAVSLSARNLTFEPSTETDLTTETKVAVSPLLKISLELHSMIMANLGGLGDLRALAFTCQHFSAVCLAIRPSVLQKLFLKSSTIGTWYYAIVIKARQSGDWGDVRSRDLTDVAVSVKSLASHCSINGCVGIFTLDFEDLVAVHKLSQCAARTGFSLDSSGLASPLLVYALLMDECNPHGPDNAPNQYERPAPRRWIDSVIKPDLILHKKGRAFGEILILFSENAAKACHNSVRPTA
ncbi:hypothetical protein MMC27_006817 [Xylographa pallens]|nr:hypothetical protein [Xylographa pallens]